MRVSESRKSFLVFFFALVFSLALAECAVRVIFPADNSKTEQPKVLVHEASPNLKLLYRPSPGASNQAQGVLNQINNEGFRDREFPYEKPAGVKRIIFLGDSVVYGYGVTLEDTIAKKLEKKFGEAGQKVEVLNFGVSGYDSAQAVEFLKELGLKFSPDLVIAGYTLNDSIYASMELDFFHDQAKHQVRIERPETRQRIFGWLFKHSRLMRLLDERLHLQKKIKFFRSYRDQDIWFYLEDRHRTVKDPLDSPYQRVKSAITEEAALKGTTAGGLKTMLGFLGIDNDDFYSSHWNVSYNAFRELKTLAEKHSFGVEIVVFPYMNEPEHYALGPMHRFLSGEFQKLGFGVIDPTEQILAAYQTEGHALLADPIHFSAKGNEIIAESIYEKLKDSKKI